MCITNSKPIEINYAVVCMCCLAEESDPETGIGARCQASIPSAAAIGGSHV